MTIGSENDDSQVKLNGVVVKKVAEMKYLRSIVTKESNSTKDICTRLTIARKATLDLARVWRTKANCMELKKRLVKALVWSIATLRAGH